MARSRPRICAGSLGPSPYCFRTLSWISAETGGSHTRNINDIGDAIDAVLRRTGVTYLLSFQPKDLPDDGKYHKLKVKLNGAPKGARVAHRPGYYAPKPYAEPMPGKSTSRTWLPSVRNCRVLR